MSEATETKPWYFGQPTQVDPVEAGRRGGKAPRRPPSLAAARRRILESKNGQANLELVRMELKALEQREQALLSKDRELADLDLALHDVQAELVSAHDELRDVEQRLEAARADDDALVALVRDVGEERLARVVEELGWYDA